MSSFGSLARCSALILGAASILFSGGALAQGTGTLTGTVTIAGGAEGMPGVRLEVVGQSLVATTDDGGRFLFSSMPSGRFQLLASVAGCAPLSLTVEVARERPTTVYLKVDGPAVAPMSSMVAAAALDAELPFSVGRLERGDLAHDPARSIADLIRGAFPGVKIVQGSGLPGSGLSIQFRGPNSISGSQGPLVVLDGLITGGGLDDLDPFDVERIEVLKGSAAAAIYGARGQAGVIEITTRGRAASAPARCFLRADPGF